MAVFRGLSEGKGTDEIRDVLGVSYKCVDNARQRIRKKASANLESREAYRSFCESSARLGRT